MNLSPKFLHGQFYESREKRSLFDLNNACKFPDVDDLEDLEECVELLELEDTVEDVESEEDVECLFLIVNALSDFKVPQLESLDEVILGIVRDVEVCFVILIGFRLFPDTKGIKGVGDVVNAE